MQQLISEAGWTGYPLVLASMASAGAGFVAVVFAAAKAWRPALVIAGIAVGFAFVGVFAGRLGYVDGMRGSYKAVAHAHPDDRQVILEGSEREARSAITLGLFSLPGGLLGAAFVPPALGLAAVALGRAKAQEAIASASPADQATIRMGVEGELAVLNSTGTSASLCPGFIGCVLIGLGLARRPRFG